MKRAAVIGHPISQSKSPLIHNHWIKKYGLEAEYGAIDIAPENLQKELIRLVDKKYAGFNVTIPHKEKIFNLCDDLDDLAKAVGAVNTVTIEKGRVKGTNTDVFGFTENIKKSKPDFKFSNGCAVVIGAGGAARAIVYALTQEKTPEIRIINRTKDKAQILARDFKNIRIYDWEERHDILKDIHLLVNATSLGMAGQPSLELDLKNLNPEALVNDIVYKPLETNLLKNAKAKGNPVVDGIGMLLHQARPAFKSWFDILPEIDEDLKRQILGI